MRRFFPFLALGFVAACSNADRASTKVATAPPTHAANDVVAAIGKTSFAERLRPPTLDAFALSIERTLPAHANDPMKLSLAWKANAFVTIAAEGVGDVEVESSGAARVFVDAARDTDLVHVVTSSGIEEIRLLRTSSAPTIARYRLVLGDAFVDARVREGRVEIVDADGYVRLATDPVVAIDANGTRREGTVHLSGAGSTRELEVSIDPNGLAYPIAVDPAWNATASMAGPRTDHTSVLLADGRVLVAGGGSQKAEIFDPKTNAFTIAGAMVVNKTWFVGSLLSTGNVLAPGGFDQVANASTNDSEIWNATTGLWAKTGALITARHFMKSVVLNDGRILVGGGFAFPPASASNAVEIFDPATGQFTATAGFQTGARFSHTLTVLKDGSVLMTGGFNAGTVYSSCELYNVSTGQWKIVASMKVAHRSHTATLLADGRVLVTGGGDTASTVTSDAEVYNPATNSWTTVSPLSSPRTIHAASILPNGDVLVTAGNDPTGVPQASTDLFHPATGTFSSAGAMITARGSHTQTTLANGKVLVVGGTDKTGAALSTAELYAGNGAACASATDCASGFCVASVCCDTACTGGCQTCNDPASVGTCKTVTGKPPTGKPACAGTDVCQGSCTGGADCNYPTTSCRAASCTGGQSSDAASCDGKGNCPVAQVTSCAPYACGATTCGTTCSTGSDCASGFQCIGGACKPPPGQGSPCTSDSECSTGHCAGGVCCDTACDGACQSCTLAATSGVCTSKPGCGTDAGTDAGTSTVPTVVGNYQTCTSASQCPSGFCVDGVCCDSACTDKCHHCALPNSPGKCSVEPLGNDLRHDCGQALSCLSTCDGAGACVSAGPGTACDHNKCTGPSSGVGAVYCSGQGSSCPTGGAVPFDCGAYACDPAFGACKSACNSSDDCAPGNTCDVSTHTCSPAASDGGGGGCNTAPEGGFASLGFGAGVFALGLLVRARRRRAPTHPAG